MMTLFAHPILIAAAVIPAVALMIRIYRADRLEREPPGLLLGLLLRGVLATVLALLAERLGNFLTALFGGPAADVGCCCASWWWAARRRAPSISC